MNYRDFLQDASAEYRLPYFGGGTVCDARRTWRIRDRNLGPGWYLFRPAGRALTAIETVESELADWVKRGIRGPHRGHHALGRFISDDRQDRLFGLPENMDLERFVPVLAWEWFDANLLFGGIEFETGVEGRVRDAFDEETSIRNIRGVTPGLAHAFLMETAARQLRREEVSRREQEKQIRLQQGEVEAARRRSRELEHSLDGRIILALSHSGAELVDWRRIGNGQVSVRYRLGGERFECLIDSGNLQIIDAGICLDGCDAELNLSSLPAAVREAIETGQLHIFRGG